jgi:hypothetical protein
MRMICRSKVKKIFTIEAKWTENREKALAKREIVEIEQKVFANCFHCDIVRSIAIDEPRLALQSIRPFPVPTT